MLNLPKNEFYYSNMCGFKYSGTDMKVIKQCGSGVVASKLQCQVVILGADKGSYAAVTVITFVLVYMHLFSVKFSRMSIFNSNLAVICSVRLYNRFCLSFLQFRAGFHTYMAI